ncbi:MAG: hypothetical protein WCS17_08060 [Prevotella sp.]
MGWKNSLLRIFGRRSTKTGINTIVRHTKSWTSGGVLNSISTVSKPAIKTVARNGARVGTAAIKGSRALATWVKVGIVAVVGIGAYRWFGSGIPEFFANLFGTDEGTGSDIAIIFFVIVFIAFIVYIYQRVKSTEQKPFGYRRRRRY